MEVVKAYYMCQTTGRYVGADDPVPIDLEGLLDLAREVLQTEDDFLGVVDSNDGVVQLIVEGDGDVWIESPVQEHCASFGRNIRLVDVVDVLRGLRAPFGPESIEWNERRDWQVDSWWSRMMRWIAAAWSGPSSPGHQA